MHKNDGCARNRCARNNKILRNLLKSGLKPIIIFSWAEVNTYVSGCVRPPITVIQVHAFWGIPVPVVLLVWISVLIACGPRFTRPQNQCGNILSFRIMKVLSDRNLSWRNFQAPTSAEKAGGKMDSTLIRRQTAFAVISLFASGWVFLCNFFVTVAKDGQICYNYRKGRS